VSSVPGASAELGPGSGLGLRCGRPGRGGGRRPRRTL